MDELMRQIRAKEEELWQLFLALQQLYIKNPDLFEKQDFRRLREQCRQILNLIGEAELSRF